MEILDKPTTKLMRIQTLVLTMLVFSSGPGTSQQQASSAGQSELQQHAGSPTTTPTRRVVTGKDSTGKAIILSDGAATHIEEHRELVNAYTMLWVTDASPANISGAADGANIKTGLEPAPHGSIFRIVEYQPEKSIKADYGTRLALMKKRGIAPEGPSRDHPRHPGMHRTGTLDYALIMTGEIDMLLDDSEVHLKAGDIVIQRGTNHAWVNHGDKPCRIAFVLLDAKE
jgi:hypothetical protein